MKLKISPCFVFGVFVLTAIVTPVVAQQYPYQADSTQPNLEHPQRSEENETVREVSQRPGDSDQSNTDVLKLSEPITQAKELIVVTGSRIARSIFNSDLPTQIITKQQIVNSAKNNLLELLEFSVNPTNTQVVGLSREGQPQAISGGPGSESIGLRGLGIQRTLILLDGRRLGASGVGGTVSAVDLTSIPLSSVERIEILKDGASSIYGADAVGGVINIISKKQFSGASVDLATKTTQAGGGKEHKFGVSWGSASEGRSFNHNVEFLRTKPIFASQRAFSRCRFRVNLADVNNDGIADSRNPSTNEELCFESARFGRIRLAGVSNRIPSTIRFEPTLSSTVDLGNENFDPIINGELGIPLFTSRRTGNLANDRVGFRYQDAASRREISPDNSIVSFLSSGSIANPVLGEGSRFYYDLSFNARNSQQRLDNTTIRVNLSDQSKSVPENLVSLLSQSRGNELEIATDNIVDPVEYKNKRYGLNLGFESQLNEHWHQDTAINFYWSDATTRRTDINSERFNAAFDTVIGPNGDLECRDLERFSDCVALDWLKSDVLLRGIFPSDFSDFVSKRIQGETNSTLVSVSSTLSGALSFAQLPKMDTVLGFQLRRESINNQEPPLSSFIVTRPTVGSDYTYDVFGEIELPILPSIFGDDDLSFNLTGRYSKLAAAGDALTHRFLLNWQIMPSVKLRVSQGDSFRGPDLFERFFGGVILNIDSSVHPCYRFAIGSDVSRTLAQNCLSEGLTSFSDFLNQPDIFATQTGIEEVLPEKGESKNIALIWSDSDLGLATSLSYFDVSVRNFIGSRSVFQVSNICYNSKEFSSPFCDFVGRDANGRLSSIRAGFFNLDFEQTKGYDLDISFKSRVKKWRLNADLNLKYLKTLTTRQLVGEETVDLPGRFGNPKWRANLSVGMASDKLSFGLRTKFIGKTSERPILDERGFNTIVSDTDNYFLHDIYVKYRTKHSWSVIASIQNLFDQQPPILSSRGRADFEGAAVTNLNTLVGVGYDLNGRSFSIRLIKDI